MLGAASLGGVVEELVDARLAAHVGGVLAQQLGVAAHEGAAQRVVLVHQRGATPPVPPALAAPLQGVRLKVTTQTRGGLLVALVLEHQRVGHLRVGVAVRVAVVGSGHVSPARHHVHRCAVHVAGRSAL